MHPAIRDMVRESRVYPSNLIMPLFLVPGSGVKSEISSMPGQYHFSVDMLSEHVRRIQDLGIPAVLLFGVPEKKDDLGSYASHKDGIIQRAIPKIKAAAPELLVITDLCFCEYTSHGHCGAIVNGQVDNDATLPMIAEQTLSHAAAGADMIAPSGMMDGAVGAMRKALDEAGYPNLPIMAYAAKYCSAFYGPFREAVQSAPRFGDRKSYQMDPANRDEALREVALDIEEGADVVMVKPALAYLDIISAVKERFGYPTAAYNVSGEYAMIKAAAANGWIDEKRVMLETLTSIKRAGSDIIITYFAMDFAELYQNGGI